MSKYSLRNRVLICAVTVLCICGLQESFSQLEFLTCSDSTFCIPKVSGLPRTKGLEIRRELFTPHSLRVEDKFSEDSRTINTEIDQNARWIGRLRFPVLMGEKLNLALGFRYTKEDFNFENVTGIDNEFVKDLEDRSLKSLGMNLYASKPFRGNKFIIGRFQADLNGDFRLGDGNAGDFLRTSAVALYGYKIDSDRTMAVGLSYSYVFGRASILPVLAYYKTSFDERWGLEMVLPASIRVRHVPDPKNVFYVGAAVSGAQYLIYLEERVDPLFLENSEINFELRYEREIHDWLWCGFSAGYRHNLSFDLSKGDQLLREPTEIVLDGNVEGAMIFSAGIFIVPPRRFFQ